MSWNSSALEHHIMKCIGISPSLCSSPAQNGTSPFVSLEPGCIISLRWFKLCVLAPLRVSWCSSLLYKYSSPQFLLCFSYSPCSDNSYHMEQNISTLFIQNGGPHFVLSVVGAQNKKVTIFQKWFYIKEKCVLYPAQKRKYCQVFD